MKKDPKWLRVMILGAFFMLFFVGCEQGMSDVSTTEISRPATPETNDTGTEAPKPPEVTTVPEEVDDKFYVYNSVWDIVDSGKMLSYARSATEGIPASITEFVATYNSENTDDQLTIETEEVPITESPTVNIFIVNEGDYAPLAEWIGLDRADFVARRADFQSDARLFGGILFVDKVPPAPIPVVDTRTREEKYSIYMVNKYNKVVELNGFRYEKHIDQIWDSCDDKVKAGYKNGIDDLMDWYIRAFKDESICQTYTDAPWRVVYGQIYTEPVDPVE